MTQTRPILAAIDRREECDNAVQAAFALAEVLDAPVEFLNALGLPKPTDIDSAAAIEMASTLGDWMAARRSALAEHHHAAFEARGLHAQPVIDVRPGPATAEVAAALEESNARLLVLGPHEQSLPFDLGSTTRALLAVAPCAVWVQNGPWIPIKRMLVPVDLSPHSMAVLERSISLAQTLGASLEVLHAWSNPRVLRQPSGRSRRHRSDATDRWLPRRREEVLR